VTVAAGLPQALVGSKNFLSRETLGIMTAAAAHWAEYRGRRTGDKKRRLEATLLRAFIEASPVEDQAAARLRSIKSVDKKIKNMRLRYNDACKELKKTGLSASERGDIRLKFGGCLHFALCRSTFTDCPVSSQSYTREPILFGSATTGARADAVGAAGSAGTEGAPVPLSVAGAPGAASAASAARAARSACNSSVPQGAADCNGDGGVDNAEGSEESSDGGSASDSSKSTTPGGSSDTDAMVSPGIKTAAENMAADAAKKTKKNTTSAAVRQYSEIKLLSDQGAADVVARGHGGGSADEGARGRGPTDGDVRIAAINLMNAFAEKTRRA